jgi:hypothetical protein
MVNITCTACTGRAAGSGTRTIPLSAPPQSLARQAAREQRVQAVVTLGTRRPRIHPLARPVAMARLFRMRSRMCESVRRGPDHQAEAMKQLLEN